MPCVEYHLLLILICLIKIGISLDLGQNHGFSNNKFLASLSRTEEYLVAVLES